MSSRFRTRGGALALVALIATIALMPFMSQAQDATPAPTDDEMIAQGDEIFNNLCVACHQPGGKGVEGIFPALNGNPLITSEDPTYFISTVLTGRGGMPRFAGTFDDTEIASIVSYVRQAWDNDAGPVSPEDVAKVRADVMSQQATPLATSTPEGQLPSNAAGEGGLDATPAATPGS
jgi:mono/diheme cytochrome c family protein